jgi:hypothetical protein
MVARLSVARSAPRNRSVDFGRKGLMIAGSGMNDQVREGREPSGREFEVEELELEIPAGLSPKAVENLVESQRRYSIAGLVLGSIIIVGGAVLMVLGFTETVDITFESGGSKGHVATGSLGTVLALIGLAIVYFTRFKVKVKAPSNAS